MRKNSLNKTFLSKPTSPPPQQFGSCRMPGAALRGELATPQPQILLRTPCPARPSRAGTSSHPQNPPGALRMLQWGPAVGSLCINVNYCLADTLGLLLDVNEGQMEAGAVWAALICTLQLFDWFYFIYFKFFFLSLLC